ncbi:MAG: ATP-grasp domain-containing protein [Aliiglaciecola sp.]|uniref:ATP-grasp domain-containing protein n=1 Tax=Aliiglaciecola sp. M165 TaxID=2593649 RepID=UPI00117D94D1|nr:ATP-grasp domain-containing protein [Aliiglaciecola sp. M165]TRY30947.1 ATP-grasp domain-containing protein [Aliiglaciecola sp. M165]
MKILIEAVGSYTSGYLIEAIQSSGHHCVASDISHRSAGAVLADTFVEFPTVDDANLWDKVEQILLATKVDVVIPTFDEMLLGWATRKEYYASLGVIVVVSEPDVVKTFNDKWLTYQAFIENGIPAPIASLDSDYSVFKPRIGRGGEGVVFVDPQNIEKHYFPEGFMSQKCAHGDEYTVDCLFDSRGALVYCVPRKRLMIKEGKSTSGVVVDEPLVFEFIKKLASSYQFLGPVNFQCFVEHDSIEFIEVNVRFGGGSSLGMAATENWIPLLVDNFFFNRSINPNVKINFGMKMYRQYKDVFSVD